MKSGNLNFLEPSGPLQACNGTDIPFIIMFLLLIPQSFDWLAAFQLELLQAILFIAV